MPTRKQRVAVVTGGGSGIGAAVAHALAADGWTVVLAGRRREALEAVVAGGSGLTGMLDAIPTDVTDEASVRSLFETTAQRFGRVDLLFNNAGIGAPSVDIDALDLESWNKVVAVNLTGAFLCTREAFRVMRRQQPQGGRIINNGSISAHAPAATFDRLYCNQTCHQRAHQIDGARRARVRYRLRTDRYRQCGDRHGQRSRVRSCPA
jgi:NAD(P)-dependent dehydrogenase (short-subunit alcohol dehydrogenase family)